MSLPRCACAASLWHGQKRKPYLFRQSSVVCGKSLVNIDMMQYGQHRSFAFSFVKVASEANDVCRVRTGFLLVAANVMEMPDFVIFAVSFHIPGGSAVRVVVCVVPELAAFVFAFPLPFLFGNAGATRFAPVRLLLPPCGAMTVLL